MKNIVKKLLATTAAVVVMSGSLGVGTLRVLAEQYYGWNDGTGKENPGPAARGPRGAVFALYPAFDYQLLRRSRT